MTESDAVNPQVSFFYKTIKAGFYMKLLKNGLCFNIVWGQSLNLSLSPSGEKTPYNLWIKELAVLVWLYVCLVGYIYMHCPVAYNPIKQKEFSSFETSAFTFMYVLNCHRHAP